VAYQWDYGFGSTYGSNSVQITEQNLPAHTHNITNKTTITGGDTGTTSVNVKIPINTEVYLATSATNAPSETVVFGQGKTGNGLATNIYTTKEPTTEANLKPFTAEGTASVTPPTVQVDSTCDNNVTTNAAISVMQKSVCINFIICIDGYYPQVQ
jgi:microcystin-dependent protein